MIMFSEYLRQRSFLNMETTLEAGENTAKNQQQRKLQQAPLPMLRKPGKHELPKKHSQENFVKKTMTALVLKF